MPDIELFKIVVAGDGGVGKTTLLHRYVNGDFKGDTTMTIGLDIFNKEIEIAGKTYKIVFWDVGGQENFRTLHESLTKGVMGAIYMFDLSQLSTLRSINEWLAILRAHDGNIPILLVGSKYDLITDIMSEDEIDDLTEYVLEVKKDNNFFDYIITSSKIGYNIDETFKLLLEKVRYYQSLKQIYKRFAIPTSKTSKIQNL